jgi:PAS domain S-box-containing protein
MAEADDHAPTVLCVDDDEDTLLLVAEHLEDLGLDTVSLSDPEAAVERVDDPAVECVVSDYAMPSMTGLELLAEVREHRPNVPFVLFTGQGSESLASEAIGEGVTDYVLKDGTDPYRRLRERVGRAVAEGRAERTRRRYTKLLGASDEVVLVLSPGGEIRDVSESVERVFGYRPDEVLGTDVEEYIHPEDAEDVFDRLAGLLSDEESAERLELRVRDGHDEWVTVEAWAKDFVADPDVGGVVVYLRDVTERAEREAWVRAVIENSTDVTSVVTSDGTVQYKGGSCRSVFGYDADELVGRDVTAHIHEDDLERLRDIFEPVVDTPGSVAGPATYRFSGPRDGWRWVESVVSNPDTDAVSGLVVNTRDVRERVEQERTLRRVESIVESMHDAAWTVDENLELTYVNARLAERMDLSRDEVLGKRVTESEMLVAEEEQVERYVSMLRSIIDGEAERRREEFTVELPDGEHQIEIQASAIEAESEPETGAEAERASLGQSGRGVVCVSRDVTERVETERRLERQNDQLELLNHIVRHDIHNDMTIISGWLSLLREEVDPEVAERFDDVVRASDHVMELLHGVGEALTVVGTDTELTVKPTSVAGALESEVARVRDVHPDAEIQVVDTIPDVDVLASEMLASVFRNLLVNAVTHAEVDDPTVVVDVEVGDETVSVSVTDEGPGLPEPLRQALMDDERTVAEAGGVGVGLYLVETLVRAYDGRIDVSEAEPSGTEFTVTFRRVKDGEVEGFVDRP